MMKKTLLFIALYILTLLPVLSQIQTFPPVPITPSKFEANLGNNRFLPSTSRYNLVWADQLVPSWHTEKQIEFAAKNYIGTQKIWANQIDIFRQFNPNFLGLIYHLAVGLNPEKNDDCPNPKSNSGDGFIGVVSPAGYVSEWTEHFLPWLQTKNIELGSARFEDMFQHWDSDDLAHRVWHNDPYWLMNIQNNDWQDYTIDQCLNWMDGNQNEGCFFDVSVETYCSLYNPKTGNPEPMNYNWWQSPQKPSNSSVSFNGPSEFAVWMNETYLKYYQKIYKGFHSGEFDRLVIPNVDQMVTTVYDPVWMDGDENGETIDGAMIEGFGSYRGQDMYLTLERCIRHITGRGKILIAQFNADTPEERYRRTAMYMLVKNDNSYIYMNPGEVGWYPEYEIDLGLQSTCPTNISELEVENGLWERMFQDGRVICNTSNETKIIEPLAWIPEAMGWEYIIKTSGGGEITEEGIPISDSIEYIDFSDSYSLAPSECVIIRIEAGTRVEEKSDLEFLDLSPTPADDEIYLNVNSEFIKEQYAIYNIQGEIVQSGTIKDRENKLDISNLSIGIYFININNGTQIVTKKFSIIR